ncbi:MAG: hypothetical protein IPK98_16835 [Chloracidobacterium sp.]|nr:hypothetical protein [Chloracidobacterium sp.]
MKTRIIIAIVILLTALPIAAQYAPEPKRDRLDSAPKAFRTFFAKFRTAVEKNNKTQVAAMTRFPFAYGYDAGDEGMYTRTQFLKNFKHVTGDFFGEYKMDKIRGLQRETTTWPTPSRPRRFAPDFYQVGKYI